MDLSWMAWTLQTAVYFAFLALAPARTSVWEWLPPGGAPGRVLAINTTRATVFISLLAAYIHLIWLAATSAPLWGATLTALIVAAIVFRKV